MILMVILIVFLLISLMATKSNLKAEKMKTKAAQENTLYWKVRYVSLRDSISRR